MTAGSKKFLSLVLSLLMVLTVFAGLDFGGFEAQALSDSALQSADTEAILADMRLGWNLGNSLEATGGSGLGSETSWSNPKTTQALIDAVKAQGFNTVRIPVSWAKHTSGSDYTIDSAWLARVKEVVDYCYNNDMYVILNIHHDNNSSSNKNGRGYYPDSEGYSNAEKFVSCIWKQVAEYFKDYDYHLIFETLNEPRLIGTNSEWWFPVNNPGSTVNDAVDCINKLNQKAVDTIRATGSNNAGRLIMCPGYDASIDGAVVSGYKLPSDISGNTNRLVVSVHAYTPYNFAMNIGSGSTATYSSSIKSELTSFFNTLKTNFRDKGIPVIIGEFSSTDKNNTAERVKWATDYTAQASELNIPCVLWDNNAFARYSNGSIVLNSEYHGYINRSDNSVSSPSKDVIEALMQPYAADVLTLTCSSAVSCAYGETSSIAAAANQEDAAISFSSQNPDICSVDGTGRISGLKVGTGYITVTASADGFEDVSKTVKVTVSRRSISGAAVSVDPKSFAYDGSEKKPDVTVTLNGKLLTSGTDYTLSYKNNIDAGTASVTAAGTGNYSGTVSQSFSITGTSISGAEITLSSSSYTYDGAAKKPGVTVKLDGKTLVSGTDYTVSYSGNTNAGTATVRITGKGGYTGTASKTFTIEKKKLSDCTVSMSAAQVFTGSAITPSVTVKNGSRTMTVNTDYTLAYSNNKNVGTAKVVIAAKSGNYTGSVTKTFVIDPAKQTVQKLETRYKGFYIDWAQKGSATGYEIQYAANSSFSGAQTKKLTANKPDTCTISGLTADKTYYVRVRSYTAPGDGKTYYGAWSDAKSIKTAKYNFANAKVSGISTKAYTGSAVTQSITVKYGGKTLKNGTDYTVKYSNNKKVGKATVTVTGKGSYGGVITKTFKINPAKQTIQKLTAKSKAFYIDWAQKGSATGYEIQYSTSSKFTSPKTVKITNNKTDKKTVSKLSGSKKYYVRVRSYTVVNGTKYYGAWSSAKSVTTKK